MQIRDTHKPLLAINNKQHKLYLSEHNLCNPNSKATCLILYLYTMETPLYSEFNKACRNMDKSMLKSLGPFATAIDIIISTVEKNRFDRIKTGQELGPTESMG